MQRDQTVLVTGGSGFLGGWCLVELLQRGYRARTTVRDLVREQEVRANVGSQVERGRPPDGAGGGPAATMGWAEAVDGCDYVLHVASPFPPAQPKDPDELIVPAREGRCASCARAGGRRQTDRADVVRGGGANGERANADAARAHGGRLD